MPFKTTNLNRPIGAAALRNVERQRQMAAALQGQAMQPLRGQMAGRVYVAPSPMQGVAKLGQMLAGTYAQNKADEREAQIQADQRQAFATDMQAYQDAIKGTPMVPGRPEVHATPPSGDPFSPDANPYQPATEYQPAIEEQAAIPGMDRGQAAMQHLINSQNPMAQQIGASVFEKSLEAPKDKTASFTKLLNDRNSFPEGSEEWKQITAQINKQNAPPKNQNISVFNQGDSETQGAKDVSEVYSKDYIKWRLGDEASQVASNLSNLNEAFTTLQNNPTIVGVIKGGMPDTFTAWNNPNLLKVKESVATVVQQNLKAILGGQFTEKEGENLIKRAFNPQLGVKENLRRIKLLYTQMALANDMKNEIADYYEKNNFSMRGYKGRRVNKAMFDTKNLFPEVDGESYDKDEPIDSVIKRNLTT